ncbi:hypothetical protein [Microbacterium hydrocarbonoxydans]|uniref:Uncharacterized protein n=1 Tax=Microbacterium hydrocarbonoxydans TaxID=273678 RepID=A0A1H4RDB4_9MICO|nr:hypothetical protein [Microbacterium hydrocarbonoxydans]SEC29892.1 hypothetical protein SAMN04489807_3363 [Microbacterium hydrocarbonoxydans]
MSHDNDGISTDRNDISSEPSPGAEENDNLGTEDNKGEPPTVVPSDPASDDGGDVLADDPEQD